MAFTVYTARKLSALLICAAFPAVITVVAIIMFDFLIGIAAYITALTVCMLIGNMMLKNPFSAMLEGSGILTLKIDSVGIIKPFIITVNRNYINGSVDGQRMQDVFDRETVFQMTEPVVDQGEASFLPEKKVQITLTEAEYNDARFRLLQFPVLIYNEQVGTLVTKEWLAGQEKGTLSKHGIFYLNRKVEELSSNIRDFARYIVDQLKPGSSIFQNKWVLIAIGVVLVILAIMFLPAVIQQFGTISSSAQSVTGVVTPQ